MMNKTNKLRFELKVPLLALVVLVLLNSCIPNYPIDYDVSDIKKLKDVKHNEIIFDVEIFNDLRIQNDSNKVLFNSECLIEKDNDKYYINSQENYKNPPVGKQVAYMLAKHLKQRNLFKKVVLNKKDTADYYLTAELNSFYGKQKYSLTTAVNAQFGLIGALASIGDKSEGIIVIEISNINIHRKDGSNYKSLGSIKRTYKQEMYVSAYCDCIFYNVNQKLKEVFSEIINSIEDAKFPN